MSKAWMLFLVCGFALTAAQAQLLPAQDIVVGGVGIESEAEMRSREKDFNTRFLFTAREGDWVANVALKVTGAGGRVVIDQTVGEPIVLARLPAGRYTATMTYLGNTQTRRFRIANTHGRGLQTVQARWNRAANDGPSMLK